MIYRNPNNKDLFILSHTPTWILSSQILFPRPMYSTKMFCSYSYCGAIHITTIASLHLSGECCRTLILFSQKSFFTQLLELPPTTSCSYSAGLQGWYVFGQLSPGPIPNSYELIRHNRKGTLGQQFPQMLILLHSSPAFNSKWDGALF